jgi:hypothetical protein
MPIPRVNIKIESLLIFLKQGDLPSVAEIKRVTQFSHLGLSLVSVERKAGYDWHELRAYEVGKPSQGE